MILYTRRFWRSNIDNVNTRKAYNLSMYNVIEIATKEKADQITQKLDGRLCNDQSILIAEIDFDTRGFAFALLDRNTPAVLNKLFDSIIEAIAENKSVYYVDDFYKANGIENEMQ
jgi:hypothetical protein